jgi:guanylate kinase
MLSKRIVLVGKAGSGKDYARKKLESRFFKYAVSYTTRPPRDNEQDGVDYIFITVEDFKQMIERGEFYEYVIFNEWYYGTTKEQFYNDDVFIMTPHGISLIKPEDRETCFIIFFDIDEEIRKQRLMLRNDADKVDRRLEADRKDFENFTDFDIRVTDPSF